MARLVVGTLHYLGIDSGDPQSTILSWVSNCLADFMIVSWIWAQATNVLLVYLPLAMTDVSDKAFSITMVISTGLAAIGTTTTASFMDWCDIPYMLLRQIDEDCHFINVLRFILMATAVLLTSGFKLSLVWTNNTLEEGENNILKGKVFMIAFILPLGNLN